MSVLKIKVIGSGGIGTALLPTLSRLVNFGSVEYDFDGAEVDVIDGDIFEESNRPRQQFRDRGNKADTTVKPLEDEFPNVEFRSRPVYITEGNIELLIKEGDLVFLCVDNHATRLLLSKHCEKLENVTLLSGGNELVDGNVQVFRRIDGENYTMSLTELHPEILEPDDENPGDKEEEKEEGCIEMVESAPQLLVTNFMVAALMLEAFHHYLMDTLDYDEMFFDMKTKKFACRHASHDPVKAAKEAALKKLRMMAPVKDETETETETETEEVSA